MFPAISSTRNGRRIGPETGTNRRQILPEDVARIAGDETLLLLHRLSLAQILSVCRMNPDSFLAFDVVVS